MGKNFGIKMILSKNAVANELFTSGYCTMNCNYCYINKSNILKDIHEEIIEKLKNGTYINELKSLYGDQLECLSFWGTEPTLTLDYVSSKIPEIIKTFPKLNKFSFSTNLLMNYKCIIDFIKSIPDDRKFNINIQLSIDGNPEITDKNRKENSTYKIKCNFYNLIRELQNVKLNNKNIEFVFKSTWNIDNLKYFNEEIARLYYYFHFFDVYIDDLKKLNRNKNIILNLTGIPTLEVPGTYTSEDGKLWNKICCYLHELSIENNNRNIFKYHKGNLNTYYYRLLRLSNFSREFFSKPEMFGCSGGKSNFQLGIKNDLHLCHRSLFMNHDGYIQSKKINTMNRHIVNIDDQYEINKIIYTWGSYHYFTKQKIASGLALIKELLYSNQIDEIYENQHLATLLTILIQYGLGCPAENILTTGSIFCSPVSLYRMFGNGAFQTILKEFKGEMK